MSSTRGLCSVCQFQQQIHSPRGSVYVLCRLGLTDNNYRKYPSLPVLRCAGFRPAVALTSAQESEKTLG